MTAPKPKVARLAPVQERPALLFAETVVHAVERSVTYAGTQLLTAVQQQAVWANVAAGLDLDERVVFRRDVIAVGIEQLPLRSEASLARRRSILTRVGEALGVLEHADLPLAGSEASTPYADREVDALRGWASIQRAPAISAAWVLLSLGLGSGLMPRDLCAVRASDVIEGSDRVFVQTRRGRITVSDGWAPPLLEAVTAAVTPTELLFLPRVRPYKNKIGDFTRTTIGTRPAPIPQRMRATWIVKRMTAGLPVQDLLHQSGVATN